MLFFVLLPYEITLLSNTTLREWGQASVLLPYEITLLSNPPQASKYLIPVLLPYEITLLSNVPNLQTCCRQFYYLMKLHYSQTGNLVIFVKLKFYYLMKLHYSQTQ